MMMTCIDRPSRDLQQRPPPRRRLLPHQRVMHGVVMIDPDPDRGPNHHTHADAAAAAAAGVVIERNENENGDGDAGRIEAIAVAVAVASAMSENENENGNGNGSGPAGRIGVIVRPWGVAAVVGAKSGIVHGGIDSPPLLLLLPLRPLHRRIIGRGLGRGSDTDRVRETGGRSHGRNTETRADGDSTSTEPATYE
jgi:hypothetical protein